MLSGVLCPQSPGERAESQPGSVAAALRSLFVQAEAKVVEQQWDQVIACSARRSPALPP